MATFHTKTEEWWTCDICGDKHGSEESALYCESRGRPSPLPVGCIFDWAGDFYEGITFAIAGGGEPRGHCYDPAMWAARTERYNGDTLPGGEHKCGGNSFTISSIIPVKDKKSPELCRMVYALYKESIPITFWDGTKPVGFEEFMGMKLEDFLPVPEAVE